MSFIQMSEQDAIDFFAVLYYGKHHFTSKIKPFGHGWSMNHYGDVASFDFNFLTRLVFLAHDRCIRTSIMQGGPGGVKIAIHQRVREGGMAERHPTINQALETWREKHPLSEEVPA